MTDVSILFSSPPVLHSPLSFPAPRPCAAGDQSADAQLRAPLPPEPFQLSALAALAWAYRQPATFTEADDLLRELAADGRHELTEDDLFSIGGGR